MTHVLAIRVSCYYVQCSVSSYDILVSSMGVH